MQTLSVAATICAMGQQHYGCALCFCCTYGRNQLYVSTCQGSMQNSVYVYLQEDATEHVGAVLSRVKHEYLVC